MSDPRTPAFDAAQATVGELTNRDVQMIHAALDAMGLPHGDIVVMAHKLSAPDKFFTHIRKSKLMGGLDQNEVDGCNAIIKACTAAGFVLSWAAYCLATTFHETGGTMKPIKECGNHAYFTRMYDIEGSRPAKARELGNLKPGDGALFCGRGFVQLTGRNNYRRATEKLKDLGLLVNGENLETSPALAMRPDIAAAIMTYGMVEGWFTGRKLKDNLLNNDSPASRQMFYVSRDIINGGDKSLKIADEAIIFQAALKEGGW